MSTSPDERRAYVRREHPEPLLNLLDPRAQGTARWLPFHNYYVDMTHDRPDPAAAPGGLDTSGGTGAEARGPSENPALYWNAEQRAAQRAASQEAQAMAGPLGRDLQKLIGMVEALDMHLLCLDQRQCILAAKVQQLGEVLIPDISKWPIE